MLEERIGLLKSRKVLRRNSVESLVAKRKTTSPGTNGGIIQILQKQRLRKDHRHRSGMKGKPSQLRAAQLVLLSSAGYRGKQAREVTRAPYWPTC